MGLFLSMTLFLISQNVVCRLKGEVVDRPESRILLLTKSRGDFRVSSIRIPITDNRFDYLLNCDCEEVYTLSFEDEVQTGAWMPIRFVSENGDIVFRLYPTDRFGENSIDGGELNRELVSYNKKVDSLFDFSHLEEKWRDLDERGELYSEKMRTVFEELNNSDNYAKNDSLYKIIDALRDTDEFYSQKGIDLNNETSEWQKNRTYWEMEYIGKVNSIISFDRLLDIIENDNEYKYKEQCFYIFEKIYRDKYLTHPYTEKTENAYKVYNQIRIGGKYIDFENPSFEGNNVRLSEYIAGKITLIDLWASWCGPCRRNSKNIIPIYEAYKDKGFTVIGVAREEIAESGIKAARQDGYPWLNLLEVGDRNNIWEKYGIGNAGGATFLVDKDGIILAIKPTLEELEQILKEKLKP